MQPITSKVTYSEFLPDINLQNFIYCYWELKTTQKLKDQFNYRVVADGCIDIFFELTNPSENFIMGFCKEYTVFPLENSFHYFGIRFLPTSFPQLFKINAKDLSNRFEKLEDVVPKISKFIVENFTQKLKKDEIKNSFDGFFLKQLTNIDFEYDHRFYEAFMHILKNFGLVNISKDLNTGLSERQLRRLFEYYIGDTAKTFSRVVKFQNILKAKPSGQSLQKNKMFFDVGYYDQAHFIKEFKNFFGVTPNQAFQQE